MPRTKNPYPAELREQIVTLARGGRSTEDLSREFEPCAATIHGWIKQAVRDGGRREDGATSQEREELRRLRRENRQLSFVPVSSLDVMSKELNEPRRGLPSL